MEPDSNKDLRAKSAAGGRHVVTVYAHDAGLAKKTESKNVSLFRRGLKGVLRKANWI